MASAILGGILIAGRGTAAGTDEFPGESVRWYRYQSPHFELFSAAREKKSRELLHQLELLRALFFEILKQKERQPLPVTVYCFASAKDFKAYAPATQQQVLGGFYFDSPDRAVMALTPVWDADWARHIIFHEYIHHLNRSVGATPPLWLNEGMAELFSTIEFKPDGVILGKHLPWYVEDLKEEGFLPLETMFAIDPESPTYTKGDHSRPFYAEAWVLLHYLRYGDHDLDMKKVEELLSYFLNEKPGAGPLERRQVFKETIGLSYLQIRLRLEAYLQEGRFYPRKARLPQIPDMKSYEMRPMTREEIRLGLAELSLRINRSAVARLYLLNAVKEDQGGSRCWETLGSDAAGSDEPDVAQERWRKALALGSANPAVFHELGQMEGRRWFENFDFDFRMPSSRTQELRSLLNRSIACTPDQDDGYALLAWVEASAVVPDPANVELARNHFKTVRAEPRTLLAFALVQVRAGNRPEALKILDQIEASKPDSWVANATEITRAKLEERAPRKIDRPVEAKARPQKLRMKLPELTR